MLFIILVFLLISSVALVTLKRDRQTLLMLGLCLSFTCMIIGIIIYIAKTGGMTREQKLFLFFDTRIQRWISYLIFPLRNLGYLIAVGRFLFPAFLLMISCSYSMVPLVIRLKKKHIWLFFVLPAISLIVYYPEIFYRLVRTRFALQLLLMKLSAGWIYLYLGLSVFLLINEYIKITIPYSKKQFRYILVFLLNITIQYGIYCGQDPMQVYQMYSSEYMRMSGRLYTSSTMGVGGWFLFSLFTLFSVVMGFWNLRNYTSIDNRENREDLKIQRKFDTASMGVSVFVHSIKNQLLSNRVLLKKLDRELEQTEPDLEKIKDYSAALSQVNKTMLERMEELYKSVKSNTISLSPLTAQEVIDRTLLLFDGKYADVPVAVGGVREETLLGDKEHLSEALYNLLTNAHEAFLSSGKAGEELGIYVHSERLYLMFEVRDNGPGISRQDLGRIFDPFYTSKNTNFNWGMGLYYVRQIIKSHMGKLKVESEPGKGTSFFVMIPRYEPREWTSQEQA